jgi:spore germination protein GerM
MFCAVALAVGGCAIRSDTAPIDVPAERNDVFGEPARGDVAAGTNRVFLLAPSDPDSPQNLRSVLRDVPPVAGDVLGSLFAGPNTSEREDGMDTAIPAEVELIGARVVGELLTVDVNDAFDDLTPEALRLAVGQIVATATEIEGIESVQLRIDGEERVWPLGSGELVDRPLTIFDYPGLVESSQPPFPAIPSPAA